jgi:sec-independent protein translocase protein TatA
MLSNISFGEFLLIAVVALVLFGPKKLPEIGRALGKAIQEFKNAAREIMEDKPAPIDKPIIEEAKIAPIDKSVAEEAEIAPNDKSIVAGEKLDEAGTTEENVGAVGFVEKPVETPQKRVSRLVTDNPRRLPD